MLIARLFLLEWCLYHTEHHGTGYGRSYKDHFNLVRTLKQKGKLDLGTIRRISAERNSFGNGCLPLVYPALYLSRHLHEPEEEFVLGLTTLVHSHPDAVLAVKLYLRAIETLEDGYELKEIDLPVPHIAAFLTNDLDLAQEDFCLKYPDNVRALNTVFHVLYAVNEGGGREMVTRVLDRGGDTDSVLAAAMLLSQIRNNFYGTYEQMYREALEQWKGRVLTRAECEDIKKRLRGE